MIDQPVYIKMPDKKVSLEFLQDILDRAVPQIGYWAEILVQHKTVDGEYSSLDVVVNDGNSTHRKIDLETVQRGIERMLREYNPRIHEIFITLSTPSFGQICEWLITSINDGDTTMVDEDVADAVLQYGALGGQEFR